MRAALVVSILIFAACGDDGPSGAKHIGDECDLRMTAVGQCPGDNLARCLSPGLSCGGGFCSQSCDSVSCPDGAVCVPLKVLDATTAQPTTIHRCFLPCSRSADCGTPDGRLYCDQTYHVCTGGGFFGNLGSTGARKSDGSACSVPPATMPPPLFGANHRASSSSETRANEPALAADGAGNVYAAWNGGNNAVAHSPDDGVSWQAIATPDPDYGGDPQLALDNTGRIYFAHLSFPRNLVCDVGATYPGGDELHVEWSDDHGATWSAPLNVAPGMFVSSHFFVDKPWLVTGPGGAVYVSFTPFPSASATMPNDLYVAFSHNRGQTWNASRINDAGANRQHGRSLIMLATDAAGKVYATWWEDAGDPLAPGGLIWMAASNDGAATWQPNVQVNTQPDAAFDDPSIAVSPDGSVLYVVYERIPPVATLDQYNVAATFASSPTGPFAAPVTVNDDAPCATHFHAAAAVDGASGDLHVIWYDNRYGDGRMMWSRARKPTAGTLAFAPNAQITDASFPFTTSRTSFFMGDYTFLVIANGKAYAAWTDLRVDVPMPPGSPQSAIFVAAGMLPP